MARIQKEDFDITTEIRSLAGHGKSPGAVVSFLGTVRDFSRGKDVFKLVFEHYSPMAEMELDRLETQAREKFDIIDCLVIHRIGQIGLNENIVLIAVSSLHRPAAFEACAWMIDELKRRVPIWKHEYTAEGDHWVEEHP
ncbi:MAG: molybdenum cofactor biosynthesis protein MoaE [Nitrospinota bacterium]|nr:molybdenum cofactor biosynthesis protein MoaE [Nitrospinota bacterium]